MTTMGAVLRRTYGLAFHLAFIGLVSVYDAWLVVKHASSIMDHERNAVGRWLIETCDGDVTLFVSCKLISTGVVLIVLAWLNRNHPVLATPVARSLSIFQAWLLWFLSFSSTVDRMTPIVSGLAVTVALCCCLGPWASDQFLTGQSRVLRILWRLHWRRISEGIRAAPFVWRSSGDATGSTVV